MLERAKALDPEQAKTGRGSGPRRALRSGSLCGLVLAAAACASGPQYYDYDVIQFKGDLLPQVGSIEASAGDFSKLTEGESLVVAIASDGSGALSQPNFASINVVEALLANRNNAGSLELLRSRCDLDGDGVWDKYCPELMNAKFRGGLSSDKLVLFDSLYTLSRSPSNKDAWLTGTRIDRSASKTGQEPIYLQLLSINRGNKTYTGDLDVHIRLPAQVVFKELTEASQVRDQTDTKATLGLIPFVGLITPVMSNYPSVKSAAEISHSVDPGGGLVVRFKDITLKPQDGVRVQYTVVYPLDQAPSP